MFIRRAAIKALSPHCIHEGLNRDAFHRNQFPRTRGKHSGHEIIHRLFSFHLADYRGDRLSRDRFRQVPLFSSLPSFWMAGQCRLRGNERISQLLCRRRATKEIPFTIGIVYDTHLYISLSSIYILYLSTLTPAACAGNGMPLHACACIEARLSRDVSHGGFL